MCGVSGHWPRPFAVGVLAFDAATTDQEARRTARVNLALDTYLLGYFLVDTIEVFQDDDHGYQVAEMLASRVRADSFVLGGPARASRLERTAARLRMTIRSLDDPSAEVESFRAELEARHAL